MTGQDPRSPAQETLSWAQAALAKQADRVGLPFREAPELASAAFEGAGESASATLNTKDLPTNAVGLAIGRYLVLLGLLPEAAREDEIVETLRLFRNQCVVARSHVASNAALDLQLFLIGPRGSEPVDEWHALALLVERDERVARKLVWLRPMDEASDEPSFDDFVRRSFLARPWEHEAIFSMAPIDNISRAAPDGVVPRNTAGEWVQLAAERQGDAVALVDGLIAAWGRRGSA